MKLNLTRLVPPGFPLEGEKTSFWLGNTFAFLFSLTFFVRFDEMIDSLYTSIGRTRTLIPGAIMPDFSEAVGNAMWGFLIVIITRLTFIIIHYAYLYQHSKSIYTMKRLTKRNELIIRVTALPFLSSAATLLLALIIFFLYFAIYMNVTPAPCLAPGQWQTLWRAFL